jgi:signal transduction histidine kinase
VRFTVEDTGRGIAAEKLSSVFEPFVQIDRHLNPESQQGVGLGLAISHDLAVAMNGDLTVKSQVGVGSLFTLTLPRAKPTEQS